MIEIQINMNMPIIQNIYSYKILTIKMFMNYNAKKIWIL